jgi:glycosyl transferase, family 25
MRIYLINLDRRQDRLAAVTAQLAGFGLAAERIAAIDARQTNAAHLARFFAASGPLGVLPKGDQCCSLSHRIAWAAFLASGAPFATFLEDDVVLDPAAGDFLRRSDWIAPGVDVVKLEHFGPQGQRVLVGHPVPLTGGRALAPILSRHTGAAAYILSRRGVEIAMAPARWDVPVDHLLFNPNVSPLAAALRPYQMLPAVARQAAELASDIKPFRRPPPALSLARRECIRAYYELRLLPRQVKQVLTGEAHLARVAGAKPAPELSPTPPPLLQHSPA